MLYKPRITILNVQKKVPICPFFPLFILFFLRRKDYKKLPPPTENYLRLRQIRFVNTQLFSIFSAEDQNWIIFYGQDYNFLSLGFTEWENGHFGMFIPNIREKLWSDPKTYKIRKIRQNFPDSKS